MGKQQAESFIRLTGPWDAALLSEVLVNSFGQGGHTTAKGMEYGIYDELDNGVEKAQHARSSRRNTSKMTCQRSTNDSPAMPISPDREYKGAGNTMTLRILSVQR